MAQDLSHRAVASTHLVARVLDMPDVVAAVRALPVAVFGEVVRHVGLEDAGDLVALATPEQLVRLLDEDVWAPSAEAADDALDGGRFALWLAILLESGADAVASRLIDLPEDLVAHGLAQQMLVLDMDALTVEVERWDEDEVDQFEKALESAAGQEIGRFRLVSRGGEHFDAVVEALTSLDRDHHELLERLLERIGHASAAVVDEAGGLHEALSEAEELAGDAAADRDARRSAAGFVATSDARAFLKLALLRTADEALAELDADAITRAWFRELAPASAEALDARAARLIEVLRAGGVALGGPSHPRLPEGRSAPGPLVVAMQELAALDPACEARRREEVAFLVNVLLASTPGRRPFDAMVAVLATCDAGLAHALQTKRGRGNPTAVEVLRTIGADRLFRAGHRLLHDAGAALCDAGGPARERG